MENLTIKTIGEGQHQMKMGDLELIQITDIAEKLSCLGGMVIDKHQLYLNSMLEAAVKANPHCTQDYLKATAYINEAFLFIAMSHRNASDLTQKLLPVTKNM